MAATPYKPVTWNGEPITLLKLNQMANNDQFLFENTPRVRYSAMGLTRDTATKVLAGKTPYPVSQADWVRVQIPFSSFFTAGCKPVVVATVESAGDERRVVSTHGIAGWGTAIDNNGFEAHVWSAGSGSPAISQGGFINWTAVGY
jgi:hypothetical protein